MIRNRFPTSCFILLGTNYENVSNLPAVRSLGHMTKIRAKIHLVDALGLEEGDEGIDGVEGGGGEGRIEGSGSARVDAYDLEAEDLFLEMEGDVGVGWGVEWVLVEEALGGLCGQLGCGGGREGRWPRWSPRLWW
ncbi:hypothetical protein NL676_008927 [Syzygium grande]|nr:hypothetical protein NL676_008927 [Syzygium grande]